MNKTVCKCTIKQQINSIGKRKRVHVESQEFSKPAGCKSNWQSIENRRKFLDGVAQKLNFKKASDWGQATHKQISQFGGGALLNYYNSSVFDCLQSVYKEIKWQREWFPQVPRSHWQSFENRKRFLDEVAKKLNMKNPSDWGKVTHRQIYAFGGAGLLHYFNSSILNCLRSVYEDVKWQSEWFSRVPRTYWQSLENRRKFLDELAIQLNIKNASDWGNISITQFRELGGAGILNYYNSSLYSCLKSVYKETKWEKEWFHNQVPKSHWKSMENQRNFLDELAVKLNIKNMSDWGKVSQKQINEFGGGALLIHYYDGSLFNCLQAVYKETKWKRMWFPHKFPRIAKTYWNSIENCRKFMDEIAASSNVISVSDWRKVSLALIRNSGGQGLLEKYQRSIRSILRALYSIGDEAMSHIPIVSSELVFQQSRLTFRDSQRIIEKLIPKHSIRIQL